jgi:hypothetical protein
VIRKSAPLSSANSISFRIGKGERFMAFLLGFVR